MRGPQGRSGCRRHGLDSLKPFYLPLAARKFPWFGPLSVRSTQLEFLSYYACTVDHSFHLAVRNISG